MASRVAHQAGGIGPQRGRPGRRAGFALALAAWFAAGVPGFAADGSSASRIPEVPVPLMSERGGQIYHDEVASWESLVRAMLRDSMAPGAGEGRGVWEALGADLHEEIREALAAGRFDAGLEYRVQDALNRALRRPGLFEAVGAPDSGTNVEDLIRADAGAVTPMQIARRNRQRLMELYPELVLPPGGESLPDRNDLLFEFPNRFLATGPITEGFRVPGGAVWQPSLLVFGTLRTAGQYRDRGTPGSSETAELVSRLDLFFNLYLTPTERVVLGLRPLDRGGEYTGYYFQPDDESFGEIDDGFHGRGDSRIQTLFFEGDLGEMFPAMDRGDSLSRDIGLSVGRQPLVFQEGQLIDDTVDAIALTRNNIELPGIAKGRVSALWGWNGVHRRMADGTIDEENTADLFGVNSEWDVHDPFTTVSADFYHVTTRSDSDVTVAGVSAVQRLFGRINSTFRVLTSWPDGDDTPEAGGGTLFFTDLSWTPPHTEDLLYVTGFYAVDRFTMGARDPDAAPLARAGILFQAPGMGRYSSPLSAEATNVLGGAIGYQRFFDHAKRRQLIVEIGGRADVRGEDENSEGGIGARFQQAIGSNYILRADVFGTVQEQYGEGIGARLEIQYNF